MSTEENAWPSIGFEEVQWDAAPDASQSRRQRLRARGPYEAAVVPAISGRSPSISTRVLALAEEATIDMVRFDRDLGESAAPFAALLLRSESVASSEIENLTAGAKRIALAQLGDHSSTNASLIASNVAAMHAAIALSDDLSLPNILAMHRALLEASHPGIAGKLRTAPVWIGGNSPHSASFVPPRHEGVEAALNDLVAFMHRDDMPILTQVAIAHAQFETIHPFPDGNGRTGRALVGALLRNKGVTQKVTIPVSSGLLANTKSYFESLSAYQQGDPEPITEMFAESTFAATDNGRLLAASIDQVQSEIHAALPHSPSESLRATIGYLVREPALSAESLIEMTGQSSSSAYRNIATLESIGALKASSHIKGRKVWIAPAVIEALDEFALRAGKRTRA
ncbi:Fic family protein [Paeniglutamicibacter sp. NPDC091659]|uniref:Fic family protein n=1 Tax=Paeniglutamicibacter sp. NPDC091659 TaxID=3364389 RepID=UPI0037F259CD